MVTLRMLWIAVAIVVGLPLGLGLATHIPGHVTVPGGDVVEMSADVAATVTDIVLADPPETYLRNATYNWPEQLVEGHTVFVTLDIPLIPDVRNWTADIMGDVKCSTHTDVEGRYFMGIPIPRRVNEAHVECQAAGMVFVTPDPFYNSSETSATQMDPTGIVIPFVAPNGVKAFATEYSYTVVQTDPWTGAQQTSTWYAWSVPILEPWTHSDGSTKQWYCPIPVSRIDEMGVTHFTGWVTESPPDLFPAR